MAVDTTPAIPIFRTTSFSQGSATYPRSRADDIENVPTNIPTSYTPRQRSEHRINSDSTSTSFLPSITNDNNDNNNILPSHHSNPIRRSSIASAYSTTSSTSSTTFTTTTTTTQPPRPWRQTLQTLYSQNYGALLVLFSQLFGNGMNVTTRLLEQPGPHGPPMHPFQILFARQLLTTCCCTLYAYTTKSIPHFPLGPPDRNVRLLLVCRGLAGFFGVFGLYFCLLYLPLAEATVLTFLTPILTCWLCSVVIPGQTFSRQQVMAGLVSLVGVVFIAKPVSLVRSFGGGSDKVAAPVTGVEVSMVMMRRLYIVNETLVAGGDGGNGSVADGGGGGHASSFQPTVPTPAQHLLAIGIAMVGVAGATLAITSIRAIGTRAHAFVSVNYFSVWSTIVSFVALLVIPGISFRMPGNMMEWALLISLGFCGFVMQGLLTMGLAYGGPTKASTQKETSTMEHGGVFDGSSPDNEDIELQSTSLRVRDNDDEDIPSSSSARKPHSTGLVSSSPPTTASPPSSSGTRATSMLYTQMLFALFSDKVFFGSVPDVWSWVGSGLILAGAIWVAAARDGGSGAGGKHDDLGRWKKGRKHGGQADIGSEDTGAGAQVGLLSDIDGDEDVRKGGK